MQPINRRLISGALFLSLLGALPAAQAESRAARRAGPRPSRAAAPARAACA
jgi:hypothetical protein